MTQGVPVVAAALIAAFIAVFANVQAQRATNTQLRIAEQGQSTDRYNAAITNLGSRSIEVRLGGIYALQRLMVDSPRDQPTVVAVLCAFVRDQTLPAGRPAKPPGPRPRTDIQAAVTVVGTRNTANDGRAPVVDFDHAQLAHVSLSGLHLPRALLSGAVLSSASLPPQTLTGAYLSGADLSGALLFSAHLSIADLSGADLSDADLSGNDLSEATLYGADLTRAKWSKKIPPPSGWVRDGATGRLETR